MISPSKNQHIGITSPWKTTSNVSTSPSSGQDLKLQGLSERNARLAGWKLSRPSDLGHNNGEAYVIIPLTSGGSENYINYMIDINGYDGIYPWYSRDSCHLLSSNRAFPKGQNFRASWCHGGFLMELMTPELLVSLLQWGNCYHPWSLIKSFKHV